MTTMKISFEVFDLLEKRLGRDDAIALAKTIDASLEHIEERSKAIAAQRKLEIKDELRIELRDELATKEDIAKLQMSAKEDIAKIDKRFTVFLLSRFSR